MHKDHGFTLIKLNQQEQVHTKKYKNKTKLIKQTRIKYN